MKINIYLFYVLLLIILNYHSLDAQWLKTIGPDGGIVYELAVSDTNLFAGTYGGGVFLSTNNGANWTQVRSGLTNPYVRALTHSGTYLFAGTSGGGVYRSSNNGTSWDSVCSGLTDSVILVFTIMGTNLFAGTNTGGIFLSTNNGTNWTEVNSGLTNKMITTFAISDTNLFAGTDGGGVFLSTNKGTNWTPVNSGLTNNRVYALTISGTNLFAGTYGGGVFLSTNNGTSWTAINSGLTYKTVIAISISGTDLFAGTLGGGVFLSTNSGTNWTEVNSGLTNKRVRALNISGINLFAGTEDGVFLSTNNGTNWSPVNSGLTSTDVLAYALEGTNLFAGTKGSGVFLSTNNGTSWSPVNSGLTSQYVRALTTSGTNLFAGTEGGGIYLTTNNGTSWTPVNFGLTSTTVYTIAVLGTNLFAGTNNGGVFLSTNNGTSWTAINSGLTYPSVYSLTISGTNLFAGTYGGVFLSTNNGTNWTEVNSGLTTLDVRALAILNANLFAGTYGGGVFLSTNNGTSWTQTALGYFYVISLTVSGANIIAGTWGDGVYLSTNNGATWNQVNTGLENWIVRSIASSGSNLFAGTYGDGVWKRSNQFGAISGFMFNDLDGDGIRDDGELGIPNWKVSLSGDKIDSTLTDSSGYYSFSSLSGTYSIYEDYKIGWIRTKPSPDSSYNIILTLEMDTTGFDFGNFKKGSINGQKFNDLDANGSKNGSDSGLANWLIRLKKNNVQIDSMLTDSAGQYQFSNLRPGAYTLSENNQQYWNQTYPLSPGTYTVQLVSGDSVINKYFGNYWAIDNSLVVRCFRDKDGSFITRDDLVSKKWNIRLYRDSISSGTLIKDTSAASFTVLDISPGKYIAVEADSGGWSRIGKLRDTVAFAGESNKDTITISADESHVITFVNFHPNTLVIKSFKDTDGDFYTMGDRTTKKWALSLYKGLNLIASVSSAESLEVINLGETTYTVLESDSASWTHIGRVLDGNGLPSSEKFVEFPMGHGENHTVDFINSQSGTITVTNFLDQDGDFRTGEGSSKPWALKLYRIEGTDTTIIDSVNSASILTKTNMPEGTYLATEADSGLPWRHIATELYSGAILEQRIGGTQNKITFTLSGGQTRHARFINFNLNRIKYWTAIEDCNWSNGYNWDPPGIPIPGDSIVVPDTALCSLVIPAGSSVGTIVVAAQETVYISPGNFASTGDVTVNGTMIANAADTSLITVGGDWTVNNFSAGQSTVVFTGLMSQIIEGNDITFYKMKIADGATTEIQTDGSFSVEENLYLGGNINTAGDTIIILNSSSNAVSGSGRITKGTLQRAIEQGITSSYRFESPQSYLQFDGTGTYPAEVSMAVIPDTIPSDYGDTWEVVPSVADTVANVITADTVKKFSKWRMGIPKVHSIDPLVRRRYTIYAKGGDGFSAKVVLRYNQSEVPIGTTEDSLVLLRSLYSSVSMSWYLSAGWNIISLPIEVEDARKTVLFPNAVSKAFYYDGAYYEEDTLKKGISYWLKFNGSQTIQFDGIPQFSEDIPVKEGWNMIGSISDTILTPSIESDPPGILTSSFFEYKGSYIVADTIFPGRGYWVKVSEWGLLRMSSSGLKNKANLIRIVPNSELPPLPPENTSLKFEEVPSAYGLEQAYPSPFNPTTTIRYQLPVDSKVTLKVHNVLGQVVNVLIDACQTAGYKLIVWNAEERASGMYFYRLEATSVSDPSKAFTQVKKMLLLK